MRTASGNRAWLTALACTAAASIAFAAPAGAKGMRTKEMYDKRYCEYLFIHAGPAGFYADVWNTFGLNDCPQKLWKASDPAALAQGMDALTVKLNGPRHWLIDRAKITYDPNAELEEGIVRSFAGLRMRRLTSGLVPTVDGKPGLPAYTETTVNRTTNFTFSRRHPIRQLVSPGGRRYAMQAYSQIKDPAMNESRLNSLASRMNLPTGWRYEVVRARKDLTLRTERRTTILQDEFENTYQLIR